jgi:hypothetical protein
MAKPIKKQRWGNIDGIGLLNGLGIWDEQYRNLRYIRKPFDTTIDLKNRILRELEHPTDTTHQGLLNGLCNEFNIDPYNVQKKTIFELTYPPVPIGASGVPDIRAYFQEDDSWYEIKPQIWSEDYQTSKSNNQGFIVWQNSHVSNISGVKNFGYSNILEIFDNTIPDESKIKIVYYVNTVDADNNITAQLYTDMDHPDDPLATAFTYRAATKAFGRNPLPLPGVPGRWTRKTCELGHRPNQ